LPPANPQNAASLCILPGYPSLLASAESLVQKVYLAHSTRPEYVAHHVAGDVGRGEFLAQLVQRPTIIVSDGNEGIAKAKAQGVYKGRKASIDPTRVKQLRSDGLGPTEIARTLKIGRASVYRVLEQIEGAGPNASQETVEPALC